MSESKSFHIHASATGKARRPTVKSLTAGTDRLSAEEDRSFCRNGMSAVRVNCRRYNGASACSARQVYMTTLRAILSGSRNQVRQRCGRNDGAGI